MKTTKPKITSGFMVMKCGGYVGNDKPQTSTTNEEPLMPILPDQGMPESKQKKEPKRCGAGYIIDESILLPTSIKWEGGNK